jgi:hypothetical protein|tara:strand:+ start:114 stop:533 length:420 start_codon:yes stop_codon:yes gene_type:complete
MNNVDKLTKEQRSVIINAELERVGVTSWGRASRISADLGVSPATSAGWLTGCLPRDSVALLRFCNHYGIDANLWVNGVSSGDSLSTDKIERLCEILKQYELDSGTTINPKNFARLMVMLYQEEDKTEFLLANVGMFLDK